MNREDCFNYGYKRLHQVKDRESFIFFLKALGLLNGIDYVGDLSEESSFAEQAFIIFMNNLEYINDKNYFESNRLPFRYESMMEAYSGS